MYKVYKGTYSGEATFFIVLPDNQVAALTAFDFVTMDVIKSCHHKLRSVDYDVFATDIANAEFIEEWEEE